MNAPREGFIKNVTISPPNFQTVEVLVEGTAPLVMERFSAKAAMMEKMQEGGGAKNKRTRKARDFAKDAEAACHYSAEGWCGFPASGIRASMIRACTLVAFRMTMAKLSIFIEADGISTEDKLPLVRVFGDKDTFQMYARNATGVVDIRSRPIWQKWAASLRVKFDADQFTAGDIINLISRTGLQVGIAAGRPSSTDSAGMGWGTFRVVPSEEADAVRKSFKIK